MTRLLVASLFLVLTSSLGTRHVTVTVHVTTNGAPIEGVPIALRDGFEDTQGKTDSSGTAVIQKELSPHQTWLAVMARPAFTIAGESIQAWTARREAEFSVLKKYNFSDHYRIDLVEDQADYSINIAVLPARTVTLRATRKGEPLSPVMVMNRDGGLSGMAGSDGVVKLGGVRKSLSSVLFACQKDAVRVVVPAGDADVDLGDISLPERAADCDVAIVLRRWRLLDKTLVPLNKGITLVSADGSRLLSLATRPSDDDPGTATTGGTNLGPQKIPAGTWYIAPGDFIGTPAQIRLSDRLANGEVPPGVPHITAAANKIATLDCDAKDIEQAIMSK